MSLVYFAFGVAGVPPGEPLAGRVLVRLLADLGLSESAARSLLLRMRREALLDSERAGREARYRLGPAPSAAQVRIEGQLRGRRPPWTGSFNGVLYEVPERRRAYRDRLRRTAHFLGYATLRPGLLVATTDRWDELLSLLPPQPPGSQLLRTRLTLSAEDSRQAAAKLWDLEAQAVRYRAALSEARARTDQAERHPPSAATGLRAFAAATLPVYEAGADDPDLPAELLPPDWPGDQIGPALGRAFQVFGPLIDEYLAALTGGLAQ
jgi:phenylacetic acid degradation operon negative regulatory protein